MLSRLVLATGLSLAVAACGGEGSEETERTQGVKAYTERGTPANSAECQDGRCGTPPNPGECADGRCGTPPNPRECQDAPPLCQCDVRQCFLEIYVPMGGEWTRERAETIPNYWT